MVKIKCSNCGHEWITASNMMFVSCTSCLRKTLNLNHPKFHFKDNKDDTNNIKSVEEIDDKESLSRLDR